MNPPSKAIVIGAGIAGLAAAIRLAVQGFEVTVYEKNDYPGGKLSYFESGAYHFDAGPSLFTQPENLEELFALAGEPITPYFTYQSLPLSFKYFYEDGTVINAFTNPGLLAKELHEKLGEAESVVQQYLKDSEKLYHNIGTVFVNHSLHKRNSLRKAAIGKALATLRFKHLFHSMYQVNRKAFKHPHTVQLFNRFATYNGSNPYRAPGMLTLIPHLELNQGTFYPQGGMIAITNALYQLALKKGVLFKFNTPVERIIYHSNSVKGVVVNQTNIFTNLIVSNTDVYFTYKYLLNQPEKAKKILKQERSSSAFIFYWGIKREFEELELHNIFFTNDYPAEFDHIFRLKKLYTDPTVYINITSKCEPGIQAPAGRENWFVMVNAPANIGQDWQAYRQQYRELVIQKLNRILNTDLELLIETEEILDPVIMESRTSSYRGSLYGTSSNSKMAAFLRHPNFSSPLKGLYFVGGSVHPGGGIPLCLKSAKIMDELVAKDYKTSKKL
jgi:phytoene desaturase